MNKTAIKNFAVWARRKLIGDVTYKAGLMGISEGGILSPLASSTDTVEFYDIGTGKPTELSGLEIKQRKALVSHIKEKERSSDYKTAFQFVMEEVAYTWFNRLVAIRFMEVNEYLPSGIRVLSSVMDGKAEPDMVTTPFETDMTFSAYETDRTVQLKDENKLDELFRMLFIKQCNKLNEVLPALFEKTSDYTEFLLNISFTDKDGIVSHLVNDIEEADFKEAVEIIGWLYQYYNTEPKDLVFANLKKNIKIRKEDIPAATQLFTPDWIVRYMVENSLGRVFVEWSLKSGERSEIARVTLEKNLAEKMGWKYYLPEAEQTPEVRNKLNSQLSNLNSELNIENVKLIDPCMGSGHILVYAFDVLMQIYESQGYTQRDAASAIIENNIHGLDIDERAYQLAYFALMMKARQYDRRFLTRGISPQVYYPKGYAEGQEFGSLLNVDTLEAKPQEPKELTIFNLDWEKDINTWNFRRLLNQKYDVVVTNPPYMGSSGMGAKLGDYVKANYPDSKSDLFACFIERCLQMAKGNGYSAMITQHAFMFLSSYEKLRAKLLGTDIVNMAHLGARAFEEIGGEVVQTTTFVLRKSDVKAYKATFKRLVDFNSQQAKEEAFLNSTLNITHFTLKGNFSKIPGSPIAYWVSEKMLSAFEKGITLGDLAYPKTGMTTGDNNRFLRLWHEVSFGMCHFYANSLQEARESNAKWFPYCKGGGFKRWYGYNEYLVNWENNGYEIKNNTKDNGLKAASVRSETLYFKSLITWSAVTSGSFSCRCVDRGFLFDSGGSSISINKNKLYLLAFLNGKLGQYYLDASNATINYQPGDISGLPIIEGRVEQVESVVQQNISLSKTDWDSFETSWDFEKHPLLKYPIVFDTGSGEREGCIEQYFEFWKEHCEKQFNQLKANEEELNRIFIDIYGLQDELTPEVANKDVTVRKADLAPDIKSLISYAVGCMFGRYSLDTEGLAYAGGEFSVKREEWSVECKAAYVEIDGKLYHNSTLHSPTPKLSPNSTLNSQPSTLETKFCVDIDNCIPITDEAYFNDDIVGLFTEFISSVYGAETLEENLDFIAKALGNKGSTARETIRAYFLKDFYKDHVKTYQKRPIYWLYDSGKQDGFKALVYMHRYNADTTGKVRVEYLHKMQKTYASEIARMQDEIENGKTPADIAKAEKRKEKLVKQLKETKDYDEKIAHLSLSRIAIDLDDGVKVNYEKVQTAQDGKVLDILGKI